MTEIVKRKLSTADGDWWWTEDPQRVKNARIAAEGRIACRNLQGMVFGLVEPIVDRVEALRTRKDREQSNG